MTTIIQDNLGLYENKSPQNMLVETHFRCDMFTDTNIGVDNTHSDDLCASS